MEKYNAERSNICAIWIVWEVGKISEGHTWYENKYGETWYYKELIDNSEELVVMKVGMHTGKIRYDRYRPNPRIENNHSHEWNDTSSKYGMHSENATNDDKKKFRKTK